MEFTYDGSSSTLTIGISNNGTFRSDPRVIGFTFNTPYAVTGIDSFRASGTEDNSDWIGLFDADNIDTPMKFSAFDAAGVTGGNLGGGYPNSGFLKGNAAIFTLVLLGSDLDLLTEEALLIEFSA